MSRKRVTRRHADRPGENHRPTTPSARLREVAGRPEGEPAGEGGAGRRPVPPDDPGLLLARSEAALAIERAERAEAVRQAAWAMALFASLSRLHETRTPAEVYAAIAEIAAAFLGCEDLAVYRIEEDGIHLRAAHRVGTAARVARERLVIGDGTVGRAVSARRLVVAGEVESDAAVAVPLGGAPEVLGAVALFRRRPAWPPLSAGDRQLLEIVGRHGGIAIEGCGSR
ncbi:MAG TPA: GAF domain-containing protein [Anaeromyxobacteraceae bacterium]|nr:GAF domain-containing protein [Anaeromyxobacteraceae bacterium]